MLPPLLYKRDVKEIMANKSRHGGAKDASKETRGSIMEQDKRMLDLDPAGFKLNDYDNIRIEMPKKSELSEEDIDAQLFEYVLSAGKEIQSINDLDDSWVKANFDGLNTVADVRQAIKDQYDKEVEYEYRNIKFANCCDALIGRLEGDVAEDVVNHNIDVMRRSNLDRLEAMHISMDQFLREEHMTSDQYEDKLRNETLYQLKLNVALDLMADVLGMQVGNHEITEYLSAPDPEAFLAEIREKGMVDSARKAAVRVKAMRRIVDTALVNGSDTPEKAEPKEKPIEAPDYSDVDIPDMKDLPLPQIRNELDSQQTHKWALDPKDLG